MSDLPVREMVLYKHGVGFFVRRGQVNADEATLTFQQDEINDVLKSLTVFDRAGGQVLGIHYQTPKDKNARLAHSSIRLSEQSTLRDLIRDLRGRRATLTVEVTPGTLETVSGRVIGLDHLPESPPRGPRVNYTVFFVTMLTDEEQVRVLDLYALRSVTIQDAQSGQDLSYFLDTGLSEDTRRTVHVRLSPGEHDLSIYYVAPSPTWRVAYRVIAESEENGQTGKALLQGWGIFDNRLDEDLENVQVTFVAGQPISFVYDLYSSTIPNRPIVKDPTRIAPGPVEFEDIRVLEEIEGRVKPSLPLGGKGPTSEEAGLMRLSKSAGQRNFLPQSEGTYIPAVAESRSLEDASATFFEAAEGQEAGEFFKYVVTSPVSVRRGGSALVPILSMETPYRRELLYNGEKLPDHPVAAFRFSNMSGLTLERGPVTLVGDGDYLGEAVVPFTKDGNEVYLPFAVELGIRVVERTESRTETARLSIADGYLVHEEYIVIEHTYIIENKTSNNVSVTLEATIRTGYELFDTRSPDLASVTEWRWQLSVSAHGQTEFIRKERTRTRRLEELRRLDFRKLQGFMEDRWLDKDTMRRLSKILDTLKVIEQAQLEKRQLADDLKGLYERQEQLRANLQALQPVGQEAKLRNRILGQMEVSQTHLEEIDEQQGEIAQRLKAAEQELTALVEDMGDEGGRKG